MRLNIQISILFGAVASLACFADIDDCKAGYRTLGTQDFFGKQIEVTTVPDVPTRHKLNNKYTWQSEFPFRARDMQHLQKTRDILQPDEQFLVGFTDSGHTYLYAKGNRSHGQGQFFAPPIDALTIGNVLQGHLLILEVPSKTIEQMSSYIASTDKSPNFEPLATSDKKRSCTHVACRQLQRATGLQLAPDPESNKPAGVLPYWPSNLVKAMVERGFVDADGNLVPSHILRTTDGTLEDVVQRLQRKENRIIRQWVLIAFSPEIIGVPAYVGYLLLKPVFAHPDDEGDDVQDDDKDEEKPNESHSL